MKYPETTKEITEASHIQICKWYRFVKSPNTPENETMLNLIHDKFIEGGGMTSEISKIIGW